MHKSILKGKWLLETGVNFREETVEQRKVKDIINDLSGYPLQVLDFMLDWFYRDLEKFPLIVLVNEDVFDMKPCVCFNLSNTHFIWESLCIKASDFYSALFALQEYDFI